MKRKATLQGLALLLVLGATTNVFANTKDNIKIEVVGGGNIDIYDNDKSEVTNKTLNQKEENNNIPYSKYEYQYLLINFKEPFTEERYKELVENNESFSISDHRISNKINTRTPILLNATNFPDNNLRKELAHSLSVSEGDDISGKLYSVTKLVVGFGGGVAGINISDLKGIGYFTSLTDLSVGGNKGIQLRNINEIRKLTNLKSLQLSDYDMTNTTGYSTALMNISNLDLGLCKFTNNSLEFISNLTNLDSLDLGQTTGYTDLPNLSKLKKLKKLDLYRAVIDGTASGSRWYWDGLHKLADYISEDIGYLDLILENAQDIALNNPAKYKLNFYRGSISSSNLIENTDNWGFILNSPYRITPAKKPLTITSVKIKDKKWDGTNKAEVESVTFSGYWGNYRLNLGTDYDVSAIFNDGNVGTNKNVSIYITPKKTPNMLVYSLTSNNFQTTGNIIKANSRLDNIKIKNSKGIATTTFDFGDRLVVEAMPKLRTNVNEMELVLNNKVIAKQNATLGNKVAFNVDLSNLTVGSGVYELKVRYGGNNNVNGTEESLGNITINKVKLKAEINESIEYNGTNTFKVSLKNIKNKKDDTIINSIAGTAIIQLNNSNAGNYNTFTVNNIKINRDKLNHYEFENQKSDITGNINITKSNIKDISSEIYVTNKLEKDYIFNLEDNLPVLKDNKTFGNVEFTNLIYNDIEKGYLKETPTIDKNMLKINTNNIISEEEKLLGEITLDVTSTNYNDFKLKLKLNSTNKVKPKLNVKQKDILTYGDKLGKLNLDFQATYDNKLVDGFITINENLESILDAGNHKISVTFIPKDNNKYDMVQGYVDVKVEKALAKAIEQPKITEITENEKTLIQSKFITKGKFQGINNKIINEDDYTLEWEDENEVVTQGKEYSYNMINNNYYIIEKQIPFKNLDGNNGNGNNENNNGSNNGNNNNGNSNNNGNINNGNGADIGNKPNTDDNSNNKEDSGISNDNLFDDLPNDHFTKDEIEYLYKKGIVKGYNRLIRPNEPITGAEFAILLNNTSEYLGVNTNNLADEVYIDVYKDKYYYNGIYKATYLDTMIGYNDKTFKPDNNMTREETVVSIYKLISLCNINIELSYPASFTDYKDMSTWAKPYFNDLNSKGIIKGNNEKFRPKESITRAEAMVLIYNLLSK